MNLFIKIINFFKTKFKLLLFLTVVIMGCIVVQYIGNYESFIWKYGIGLGLAIPLFLVWNWLETKISKTVKSDHERSVLWLLLFLFIIPFGVMHIVQKEWHYQYHFPMCDCTEKDDRADRVGAICKDGIKSYATGRGTCSEHNGVQKWQCDCD